MKIRLFAALTLGALILGAIALPHPVFLPDIAFAEAAPELAARLEGVPDDSILLVNRDHPLPEGYKPTKLVNLYNQKKRAFKLADSDIRLEKHVFEAVNEMFKRAKEDGVSGFIITSGYRTEKKQKQLYKADKQGVAAKPGHSEHQTGLAFDVTAYSDGKFETTKQFKWLSEHCWAFGFILRYPEGAEAITGFTYEPWHYRYVGVEAAEAMRDSGQTLEEFLGAYIADEVDSGS